MSLNIIKKIARINPYDDRVFKYFDHNLDSVPREILRIQYRKGEAKILAEKYDVPPTKLYDRLSELNISLKGKSEAMRQHRLKGKKEPSRKELIRLHEKEGLNIPAIARKLGFSHGYIRNRFKRDNINYNVPKRKSRRKQTKKQKEREKNEVRNVRKLKRDSTEKEYVKLMCSNNGYIEDEIFRLIGILNGKTMPGKTIDVLKAHCLEDVLVELKIDDNHVVRNLEQISKKFKNRIRLEYITHRAKREKLI